MALSEKLSTIDTIENLATNKNFLGKLIVELNKGANDKGIYTKKGVDDELRKKANTADVYTKRNVNDELAKKADKNYVDAELGEKAGAADLANKANTADVYTKTDADTAFVKATELKTKAAAKDVVDAIIASTDFTDKVYTKNDADTAFVKTADLATKVAKKAVVDALIPELAKGDDDNGIYTKKGVDDAFVKTLGLTDTLKTEVVKQPVVDAITASPDFTNKVYIKAAPADEVYTKTAAETAFVKATELKTKAAAKDVVNAIFDAKDGDKSILVDKLGGFLDATDTAYGDKNDQTAKVFLGGKGLKGETGATGPKGADGKDGAQGPQGETGADGKSPTAAEIATEKALQEHVTKISIQSPEFKRAVQEEMSQPYFEPPTSDDAALNWTW
ncbi:collagen-like protein [Wolbachia endosymbiont of Zaprionus taronus]|uniref:collagen-like protein n=1 Tax=Wolbachia endosymbiont of Zaprionus taronus TaxID=2603208 RepID=UPI00294A8073|nr:collagen-like protein [Wolbachia endosymbiont of Zaprionus taronus]MDV6249079.1 collagen-like protein [Wolbachia endosymbiont of Zaprionus taronus]